MKSLQNVRKATNLWWMKYMDILSMLIDKTQYCPDASSSELDQ